MKLSFVQGSQQYRKQVVHFHFHIQIFVFKKGKNFWKQFKEMRIPVVFCHIVQTGLMRKLPYICITYILSYEFLIYILSQVIYLTEFWDGVCMCMCDMNLGRHYLFMLS